MKKLVKSNLNLIEKVNKRIIFNTNNIISQPFLHFLITRFLVTLKKFENTEKQFSAYKSELESRQAEIAAQIAEAKEKILEIRKQRKIERKQFKDKEKILKEEIEFHIDTARSVETRAEKFQNELERLQEVPKCEIGAQTSFIFPEEICEGKNENSKSNSFNTSQSSW